MVCYMVDVTLQFTKHIKIVSVHIKDAHFIKIRAQNKSGQLAA